MKDSLTIVITGMHRSGTSAVASELQQAGVWIGSQLVPADDGNTHGYFEDKGLVEFHDAQLARSGQRVLAQAGAELKPPRKVDVRLADRLIRERREHPLWGWKDPRTSLYLDFWAERLPQARFLLLYRDPLEVVTSLLRRGSEHELEVMTDPTAGLRSWRLYNESILDFRQRLPERCFLVDVHQVIADPEGFLGALMSKLELPLCGDAAGKKLFRKELHQRPASKDVDAILERIDPPTAELMKQLSDTADWTAGAGLGAYGDVAVAKSLARSLAQLRKVCEAASDPEALARPALSLLLALLDTESARGASPEARVLGLLEDVARLRRHANNLEADDHRSADRIERLQDHSGKLEARLAEVSKHNRNLEAQVPGLEKNNRNLEERVAELESHNRNLEARIPELESHNRNLEEGVAGLQERVSELDDHNRGLEAELAEASRHVANLEDRDRELTSHVDNLESRNQRDEGRIEELRLHSEGLEQLGTERATRVKNLESHLGNLEKKLEQAQERSSELEVHSQGLEEELSGRSQRLLDLETHLGNLEALRSQGEERVAELEAHTANLERSAEQSAGRIRELEAHVDNLTSLQRHEQERLSVLSEHSENLERSEASARQRIRELETHIANLEEEMKRLDELEAERVQLLATLEAQDGRLQEMQAVRAELRELLARKAATIAELEARCADLQSMVEDRDRQVLDLESRQQELIELLASRDATIEGLEGEARRLGGELEEALEELRRLTSRSWLLKRLHLLR